MNVARWLVFAVTLSLASTANAQFRRTHLTTGGGAVVEATASDVKACESVYRWDRCRSSRRILNVLTNRGAERRTNCITSSRNVAARRGATHFVVQGHIFTGYRCVTAEVEAPPAPPAPVEDPRSAELAAEMARYRDLGFVAWGGVCTGVEELFSERCETLKTSFERVTCREVRTRALSAGERIYYQPYVDKRIDYDGKTRAFTVQFKGVLARLEATGGQRYLTSGPLVVPRRGTATEALADAAKSFGQLTVPAGDLQTPETFEQSVLIEALVRPKAIHAPAANNPAQLSALEVEVVALRAYLPDLSWGAVVVPSPEGIASYRCPPLQPPPKE
jgi:hypothetical protein